MLVPASVSPFAAASQALEGITVKTADGATVGVKVTAVDFSTIPYVQQVELVHERTAVLVGMHGAGMVHSLELPIGEGATTGCCGMVELFPGGCMCVHCVCVRAPVPVCSCVCPALSVLVLGSRLPHSFTPFQSGLPLASFNDNGVPNILGCGNLARHNGAQYAFWIAHDRRKEDGQGVIVDTAAIAKVTQQMIAGLL